MCLTISSLFKLIIYQNIYHKITSKVCKQSKQSKNNVAVALFSIIPSLNGRQENQCFDCLYMKLYRITVRTPCHRPISFLKSRTFTRVSPKHVDGHKQVQSKVAKRHIYSKSSLDLPSQQLQAWVRAWQWVSMATLDTATPTTVPSLLALY